MMGLKLKLLIVMAKLRNVHPGEILLEEFLKPREISAYRLSKDIGIPQTRTRQIIKGRRRITADTSLRLRRYFGTSPKFWVGLQNDFDLEDEQERIEGVLLSIPSAQ
jgi:addiction module HigA family antidote